MLPVLYRSAVDIYLDNPAGRLYIVLNSMRNYPNPGSGLEEALPVVFTVAPELHLVARAIGEVYQLPSQAVAEVQQLTTGQAPDRLLRWAPNVNKALASMLYHRTSPPLQIGTIASQYDDADMISLDFCSEALHLAKPGLQLKIAQLQDIEAKLTDLRVTLEDDSDLDLELRSMLLDNVNEMIWACRSYHRTGTAGVRHAVNQTVGAVVNNWNLTVRQDTSPGTWAKFTVILGTVTAVVGFGTAVATALEAPPPSSDPIVRLVVPGPKNLATPAQMAAPAQTAIPAPGLSAEGSGK